MATNSRARLLLAGLLRSALSPSHRTQQALQQLQPATLSLALHHPHPVLSLLRTITTSATLHLHATAPSAAANFKPKPWQKDSKPTQAPARSARPVKAVTKPRPKRNDQLPYRTMRVIFPDGTNQVLARADALAAAKAHDLDLVEVGGKADPPVVKILNYRELERKLQDEEREAAKKAREQKKFETPKEMQFSPRIGDHDLEVKMRKCREFLDAGLKVALVVKHKTQEAEAAAGAGDYLAARLQSEAGAELERREAGSRSLVIVLRPTKRKADS